MILAINTSMNDGKVGVRVDDGDTEMFVLDDGEDLSDSGNNLGKDMVPDTPQRVGGEGNPSHFDLESGLSKGNEVGSEIIIKSQAGINEPKYHSSDQVGSNINAAGIDRGDDENDEIHDDEEDSEEEDRNEISEPFSAKLVGGFKYLYANPDLLVVAMIKCLGNVAFGFFDISILRLLSTTYSENRDSSARSTGLFYTWWGVGTFVAPFLFKRFGNDKATTFAGAKSGRRWLIFSQIFMGTSIVILSYVKSSFILALIFSVPVAIVDRYIH